jgi:spore coat protein U-like protein
MTCFSQPARRRGEVARKVLQGMAAAALAALAHPALAVTCTVSAPAISFNTYDTKNNDTSATTITISCGGWGGTKTVNYTLTASAGSGSYSSRQILNGSQVIFYNLYTNSAHTAIWGDGNSGTATFTGTVTNSSSQATVTVYGLINGGQNVVPGSYTTTLPITVTLTYQ